RAPSETDRRVSMLSLSADGRALFDRVAEKALEYEDELMAALALKERRALDAALSKLMAKTKT
ncbi:MAG: hypothetical protein KJN99_11020, partial [Marinicaulis sp.]|nr:hypothetical protein [Marinicaulis sp.]